MDNYPDQQGKVIMKIGPDVLNALAACVSASASVVAVVGLVYYVVYKKRMMESSENTLRASIEPILTTELSLEFPTDDVLLRLRNEGNGTSFGTSIWCYYENPNLKLYRTFIRDFEGVEGEGLGPVRSQQEYPSDIGLKKPKTGQVALFIIQGFDVANGIHQLHVRYSEDGGIRTLESFRFREPNPPSSKGKRRTSLLV